MARHFTSIITSITNRFPNRFGSGTIIFSKSVWPATHDFFFWFMMIIMKRHSFLLGHDIDQCRKHARLEECHKYLHSGGVVVCVQAFHVLDINARAVRQILTSVGSLWARFASFSLIKWTADKLVAHAFQFNGGGYCFHLLLDVLSQWNLGSIIGKGERLCCSNESSNLNTVMLRY